MRTAKRLSVTMGIVMGMLCLTGCGQSAADGKIEVEMVSYKPEAVAAFEQIEERFNATHDDIHLTIDSPNEAMTILKTRFIREDYPDIVGIGGDINYSGFLDADLFMDISNLDCRHRRGQYMENLLEDRFSDDDAHACHGGHSHGTGHME